MEEYSLELLFHDQSRLAECLGQTKPFGLAVVRPAWWTSSQRSRDPAALLCGRDFDCPAARLAHGSFWFRLGGSFRGMAGGAASVAFAICHGGKGVRIGCSLYSARLSLCGRCTEYRKVEVVDRPCGD